MALDIVLPIAVRRIEKSALIAPPSDDGLHDAGFTAGYEEGKLRGEWEARREQQKLSEKARAVIAALEKLHAEYESLVAEHLPDLIQGALHRVFRQHPFSTEEIGAEVAMLLRDMEQAGRIALECAPGDLAELQQRLEMLDAIPDGSKFALQANPALSAGEFVLRSDLGDVDGRHSSRIRQIHHALEASQ